MVTVMRAPALWVATVLLWVAVALPAWGQAPPPAEPDAAAVAEGRARFKKGVELFHEGNFEAALVEFRRAYEAAPAFPILYNIGQVLFELRDYAGALDAFQDYLARGGSEIPAERRSEVEAEIQKLEGRVAQVEVLVNAEDAEILVDDVLVGMSPLAEPLVVSAGRRSITASKEGMVAATRRIEVAGGDRVRVDLTLTKPAPATGPAEARPAPPAPKPSPPPPPAQAPNVGLWISLVGAGALTAGAVVTGVLTLDAKGGFEAELDTFPGDESTIDAARSELRTLALVTDVLAGAALVAGGAAIVFAVIGSDGSDASVESASRSSLRLAVTPRGIAASGSF